jgi:aminotransferase
MNGRAIAIQADVSNMSEVSRMVAKKMDEFGKIDILVNNVGIVLKSNISGNMKEEWTKVIEVNLLGTYYCTEAVKRHMVEQKHGKIICYTTKFKPNFLLFDKIRFTMMLSNRLKKATALSCEPLRELARASGKRIIRAENADPNFDPPIHIVKAAEKALQESYVHHYTPGQGLIELREAVAERIRMDAGVVYDPKSEIMITTGGVSEAIYDALQAIINPGDEVILPSPTYLAYEPDIRFAGGTPVPVPFIEDEKWRLNIDGIKKKISRRTKAVILNSPNNPTGFVYSMGDLEAIASELAGRQDIFVLFDAAFDKIVYDGVSTHIMSEIPEMKERTIIVNGVSKVYSMCGYRTGWLVANSELVKRISETIHACVGSCSFAVSQLASVAALRGPQGFLTDWIKSYQERRDLLIKGLDDIGDLTCPKPEGGFFAFINISRLEKNSNKFSVMLAKNGLVVTPGKLYGKYGEGHIRIAYGPVSKEEIIEIVNRIAKVVKELR